MLVFQALDALMMREEGGEGTASMQYIHYYIPVHTRLLYSSCQWQQQSDVGAGGAHCLVSCNGVDLRKEHHAGEQSEQEPFKHPQEN